MSVSKSYHLRRLSFVVFFVVPFVVKGQIYFNQVGFPLDSEKNVFISQYSDSFKLFNTTINNPVYDGRFVLHKNMDPNTGLTIYKGDFSAVDQPGEYYFDIPGLGTSNSFKLAENIYSELFQKSLKGFYFQRCGMDLIGPPAGNYYHSRCHTLDAQFHNSTGFSGYYYSPGGWHDAGDYGKYIVNAAISVGTLLMAYEYFPDHFGNDDLIIPESGNGVPDILDEVRYELEWFLMMQHTNGGVFFKVTPEQFSSILMPQNDNSVRFVYELSSTATGGFAAVMAIAARVYQQFDTTFATSCLSSAELAWTYLSNYPTIQPAGGFSNPTGTITGEYGDSNDRDERLWAASELYLTTGEVEYHNFYQNNYNQQGLFDSPPWWGNVKTLAHLAYLLGNRNGINTNIQNLLKISLENYCLGLVNKRNGNGFHVLLNSGEYRWGSNSSPLNDGILLIFGYEIFQNLDFKNTALDQLHYILGVNAHQISFVTGVGRANPKQPHHRPSMSDGVAEPVPGLLVGGPNEYLQDAVLAAQFTSSTPPALCYIDSSGSYASNEIAINWNAPLTFVSGYFGNEPVTGVKKNNQGHLPNKFKLKQNYPNPFNGRTIIPVQLATPERLVLSIYDVTGQKIYEEDIGLRTAGDIYIKWNPENEQGKSFASGIYYYSVKSGGEIRINKMIYLK